MTELTTIDLSELETVTGGKKHKHHRKNKKRHHDYDDGYDRWRLGMLPP
jgi:hypothetical protein